MNRRTFLATLGTVAAGTSVAVGTGAFTSVSADRTVTVSMARDEHAYLGLEPASGPNEDYAERTTGSSRFTSTG